MDTPTDYFLSMTEPQDVRIPTNGEQLAAYVYRPDVTEPPRPCIVMAHGFSATRDDGLPATPSVPRRRVCRESQPGIRDDIAAAERQYREGTTVSGDALREEFGLPPQ